MHGFRELLVLGPHQGNVTSARFSADGRRVLTTSWDGMVRLFDSESGERLVTLRHPQGNFRAAQLSRDGTRVATIDSAGNAQLWRLDGKTGEIVATIVGAARGVTFSSDGRWIVVHDWSGTAGLVAATLLCI